MAQSSHQAHRMALLLAAALLAGVASGTTRGQPAAPSNPPGVPDKLEPGLEVTFTTGDGKTSDVAALPNVWLYVPAGQPPTPFLPAGSFTAVWTGFLSVESRADFQFEAELNGDVKVVLNGVTALEATGHGQPTAPGKPVRLNRGANALTAVFRSPATGDAWLRLFWFNKDVPRQPVPLAALTFANNTAGLRAQQLRRGRELFIEYRCARCHAGPSSASTIPELQMDAPAFEGIGARRNVDWLARWILDPHAQQPAAVMPRSIRGAAAVQDARAIAAFLASSAPGGHPDRPTLPTATPEQVLLGKGLFDSLYCIACHNALDSPDTDPTKISLSHVREKFPPQALSAFLLKPDADFAWIHMPRFQLTEVEAAQLAAYLDSRAAPPANAATPPDGAVLDRGRELVQTRGCLNCHNLELQNRFHAPSLASLTPEKWGQGCLAASLPDNSPAPRFALSSQQREDLRAFGTTDRASLSREVPAEFAARQTRRLRCRECHGKFDGFPVLDVLGGKLKPEWTTRFVAGEVAYKPRPWLQARMPAFPRWAEELARGLAMRHGYPPRTPAEPPIDRDAAAVGRKLVGAVGGLSCVSCHAVGSVPAMQVADSPGANLAHAAERLLRPYFERWVRNPQQIDPSTKMPVFFDDEDRSPLAEIYGGDGAKQREAIWQYLRLGDQMPPPPTP